MAGTLRPSLKRSEGEAFALVVVVVDMDLWSRMERNLFGSQRSYFAILSGSSVTTLEFLFEFGSTNFGRLMLSAPLVSKYAAPAPAQVILKTGSS